MVLGKKNMKTQEDIEFERAKELDDELTTFYLNGCYKTPFDCDLESPYLLKFLQYYIVGYRDANEAENQ